MAAEEAETFLERKLRPDLNAALRHRQDILDNIADLDELKKTVALLHQKKKVQNRNRTTTTTTRSDDSKYKQLVDVGAEHFVVAEADVIDRIFLKIGLGFLLEVTLEEASPLIDQQKVVLQNKLVDARSKVAYVQRHIAQVEAALAQLRSLV